MKSQSTTWKLNCGLFLILSIACQQKHESHLIRGHLRVPLFMWLWKGVDWAIKMKGQWLVTSNGSTGEKSWGMDVWYVARCQSDGMMETHVITIKPPLQIMDIGNGCKAYSASIYIPAKSELMATLQSVTRSQFFLNIILTILM